MTQQEIQILEIQLGKTLPKSYRFLLQNYPEFLLTAGEPYNTVCEFVLLNSIEKIVYLNSWLQNDNPPLPNYLIAIGDDGAGNCYFINTQNEKIYFFDHENQDYEDDTEAINYENGLQEKHQTIQEFVQYLTDFWQDEDFLAMYNRDK